MHQIKELLNSPTPVKWLFCGDSITQGSRFTYGSRCYPELFAERLRFELERKGDLVLNTAASGYTSRHLVDEFDWRIRQFQPDVVFLMVGANDCHPARNVPIATFRRNLRWLCRAVREIPDCRMVLQTPGLIPPGSEPQREPAYEKYLRILRAIARDEQAPLIDHARYWQQKTRGLPHLLATWTGHGCHPNAYGHRVFAELIFETLGILDPESETCRLFYPHH